MPMISISLNINKNIPIKEYALNAYKEGEWAGDAEISMIPLVYDDIRVACYELIKNNCNTSIIGYRFIQTYGNFKDLNTSILILVNINNMHWVCGFYNNENGAPILNYIIPNYSINDNKTKIKNKIKNNKGKNLYNNITSNKEYELFKEILNNLQNKSLEEVTKFYSSGEEKIDFGSIYFYLKHKDLNKGVAGKYPENFSKITKNKGNRLAKNILN